VAPAYEGLELGIGDSLLVKAICEATGRKKDAVEQAYEKEGDLGTVALTSRANQKTLSFAAKPKPLMASQVLESLKNISKTKGEKAQGRKVDIIKSIMIKCQGSEAKYIVRSLQGKLRIGTAEQTVLVSLAHAAALSGNGVSASSSSSSSASSAEDAEDVDGDDMDVDADADAAVDDADKKPEASASAAGSATATATATATAEAGAAELTLLELIDAAQEQEPAEAAKLRKDFALRKKKGISSRGLLAKEVRCELAVVAVKRAFSECPNISILVHALLSRPLHELYLSCRLIPGVPVAPMLAKPTKEVGEVLRRLSGLAFTMEYKYDGERAQVHLLEDGSVKIFSRNSEDNSQKYPDLREVVRRSRHEGLTNCVLDAEVVAYDREKKCLLPFQVLSTRKRKVEDGDEENQTVKVVLQIFDMIFANGKSLLQLSLRQRRTIMRAAFREEEGFLYFASGSDHVEDGDTAPIEAIMQEACASMCEGLMVKTLDDNASYEPSKRSLNWLKLKKDYIDGMGVCDSVDLVCIGGYMGRGKRVNVYGAYLMACYDPDRDEFQSVCKVGTGFKDEDLTRLTEKVRPTILGTNKRPLNYNVGEPLTPDHWFEATYVWELQAADLSKSNVHKGGVGRVDSSGQRGIGLRFPRFIRERDDKKPEGATSAEQIVDMYQSQGENQDNGNGYAAGGGDDDDNDDGI
jgi:DNA ligase-1